MKRLPVREEMLCRHTVPQRSCRRLEAAARTGDDRRPAGPKCVHRSCLRVSCRGHFNPRPGHPLAKPKIAVPSAHHPPLLDLSPTAASGAAAHLGTQSGQDLPQAPHVGLPHQACKQESALHLALSVVVKCRVLGVITCVWIRDLPEELDQFFGRGLAQALQQR